MKGIKKRAAIWILTVIFTAASCLIPCTAEAPAQMIMEETGLLPEAETSDVFTEEMTQLQELLTLEQEFDTEPGSVEVMTEQETSGEAEMLPEDDMKESASEEECSEEISSEEVGSEEISSEMESIEEEIASEEELFEGISEEVIQSNVEDIVSDMELMDLGDVTAAVEITACLISGDRVVVEGHMNTAFTTWNGEFYLFEEEMYETDITGEPIAVTKQSEKFRFEIPLVTDSGESRLYSKFFVGVQFKNKEYVALGDGHFITNPEVLAENQSAYPETASKKGLFAETYWGTDLDELGVNHVTVNLLVNELLSGDDFEYVYNGKTYRFSSNYIYAIDNQIRTLQKNNINAYAILLVRPGENSGDFAFPEISQDVGQYHGWNVVTEEGIDTVSAVIHFFAERYSRSDGAYGHIANWIVSNEVNADTSWNYTGHQPVSEYALIYSNMMRITYQAVKSCCAHARVYMPLDMFWNNSSSSQRYDGKRMVDLVNRYMKAEGDIPWGIAFHPYANPLTEAEWWNDNAEMSENAGFISMQNLSVLTDYLQKSVLRDPDGGVKKVILSEQGFTSYSNNQGNVEWKQAAAYAYAYYVAESNPYIQALIVMRQKDAAVEAMDGLHQGMWYDNVERTLCTFAKKPVWTVWKYIDTAHSFDYTDSLAPIVGLPSFSGIYANVMASKTGTVTEGKSGYAGVFESSSLLGGNWAAEYMIRSFEENDGIITVQAGENNPFAYSGIVWNGNADFSETPLFGFDFTGTAGEEQNLRVRMRFTSGQDIYETEIAAERDTACKIYADLSGWSGCSSVNRIQIWVQQDGVQTWQNGSFTISDICMASGADNEAVPSISITDAGVSAKTESTFSLYCTVNGSGTLARAEFSAWHIKTGTSSAVMQEGVISGNTAEAHFDLATFGWKTGAYNVRIIAYDDRGLASKETVVSVTVDGVSEALVISNAYISGCSSSGFTIIAEADSSYGMAASRVAVWSTDGGQDDLIWYPMTFDEGSAAVRVNISAHNYDSGEYMCHVYARDNAGNQKVFSVIATVPTVLPEILSAEVTDVSALGYTVTCTFSCPNGLGYVMMPTWTDNDWQDDISWYTAPVSGNTASLFIKTADHNNEAGLYYTHIYVFDRLEKSALRCLEIKIPEDIEPEKLVPEIISVEASDVTSNGYRVTAVFTSPAGVREVVMPTWTAKNAQDDLIWHLANVSGNKATFYVTALSHNDESGTYITHVYLRDNLGRETSAGIEVTVPEEQIAPPVIDRRLKILSMKTSDVTSEGYKVTVAFEAPAGVLKVEMPTWTLKDGQDDLIWHAAKVSGNTAEFYVSTAAHKGETGRYMTHVYVYDKVGEKVIDGFEITVPEPVSETPSENETTTGTLRIISAKAENVTSAGYLVKAVFEAPKGVKEVVVPTWTSRNGQDDLIWHKASVSGNTAEFYVKVSDHKGEAGAYITHVYVRDKAGKEVLAGLDVMVPEASNTPSGGGTQTTGALRIISAKAENVTSAGYYVKVTFEAPKGVKEVVVPTWTSRNGQDDLIWHKASVSGNTAEFYVKVSDHKGETGAYITHVYVRDQAGKEVLTGLDVTVPSGSAAGSTKPTISRITVSEQSASGYRVTVTFTAPAGVKEVKMPSWSDVNGQDDVVWHQASVSGNTATCYIAKSSHKNNTGTYTTHVYVYDILGQYGLEGTSASVK